MEFEGWPKTARLNKEAVYTEKLDGTNGAIVIERAMVEEEFLENDGIPKGQEG